MEREKSKFQCPCCGYYTLIEEPPGTYEICTVCDWEDDPVQYDNSDFRGGANEMSLNEVRESYLKIGAKSQEHLGHVRLPLDDEKK
jgi:hypothetical protein